MKKRTLQPFPPDYFDSPYEEPWYLEDDSEEDDDRQRDLMNEIMEDSK